jgi:ATP-dependent RNA helicase DeaD
MNKSSTFLDMPLSEGMKQTIIGIGYKVPTPIQEQSIPELLLGNDLMGQAQTGTGKTAAFSIPLVELVDEKDKNIQALVVCPTRELCLQVCQEIKRLSIHKHGLEAVAIYGGQSIEQQFRALKSDRPQIVVATPGRLFDHLRRKSIQLSQVRMIVLDEADEMLDMGFRPEIEEIFGLLPEENQRIFFSATMAKAIKDLACSYLRNPKIVKTESKSLTVSTISQSYFRVRGKEKTELLCRILNIKEPKLAVVFCNAKSTVDEIVDEIKTLGFEAGVLHGDLSQNQRDRVMAQFKSGLIRVLVATDVAARGLDIDDVELVCNYHLPHDPEDYVHRIGRTGRAGRTGYAISLVEPRDNSRLRRISQFAKIEIAEEQAPSLSQVKAAKLANLFGQVKDALTSKKINEYRAALLKQDISPEDVAVGMIQLALQKFDDSSKGEAAFEELRNVKYSGYDAEKRFKGRSERESRPFERDNSYSRQRTFGGPSRRKPSGEDFADKRRGPRSTPVIARERFADERASNENRRDRRPEFRPGEMGSGAARAAKPRRFEQQGPADKNRSRDWVGEKGPRKTSSSGNIGRDTFDRASKGFDKKTPALSKSKGKPKKFKQDKR